MGADDGLKAMLEGRTIEGVEVRHGDLYLLFDDGYEIRIGIEARYCDRAWLVLQGLEGADILWERQLEG